MKKQKSYHWHFIIAVSVMVIAVTLWGSRMFIFFGTDYFVEKAIAEKGVDIERIEVRYVGYEPIVLEGGAVERFCMALGSIKIRKLGRFDSYGALDGNTKYPWILGSKAFDLSAPHQSLRIDFYSAGEVVLNVNTTVPEGLNIDESRFFIKTPVFADDIFAMALASKN